MQSESENAGTIEVEEVAQPEPTVSEDDLSKHFPKESVSISLKYYSRNCECFSAWQQGELKKFSSIIEKISSYGADLLQRTHSLCDSHKGPPKTPRFIRPETVSDDILFHELKVDPGNKARVHGFFVRGVFFLVWLDRKHECFKQ